MHVVMLAWFYEADNLHPVLQGVSHRLDQEGVRLTASNAWSDSFAAADLVIVAHPIADREALSDARLLGQRTLNRYHRLAIADRVGATVAPFGSPSDEDELTRISKDWAAGAVLKYDWSARRKGVFHWPLGDDRMAFPPTYRPGADVFMEFLPDDPLTYKVDAFGGTIMATWVLPTRDMREPKWQWIKTNQIDPFDAPEGVLAEVRAVSAALLRVGVGHASFDLMRNADGYAIIELNSCSVGTEAWDVWPDLYAENLARGILRVLEQPGTVPPYSSLRHLAKAAGNEAEVRGSV